MRQNDKDKYDFKIRNSASGLCWQKSALEAQLRSYCRFKGLEIEVFSSGWLIRTISFVISGSESKDKVYGEILSGLENIYAQFV